MRLIVFGLCLLASQAALDAGAFIAPPTCVSPRDVSDWVRDRKSGAELRVMKDEEAAAFLSVFNAQPPPTEIEADIIILISGAEGGETRLVFFRHGCLALGGRMPEGAVRAILLQIERSRS